MNTRFFKVSHDLLCVMTLDGVYRHVNPSWTRVLGWQVEDLEGRSFREYVHADDIALADEHLGALGRRAPRPEQSVVRHRAADGTWRWIDWRSSYDDDSGHIYAAGRDVTDQVRLQERIATRDSLLTSLVAQQSIGHDDQSLQIAGELHDGPVQHCVAALMLLDPATPGQTDAAISTARSEIQECLDDLRRVMDGIDVLEVTGGTLQARLAGIIREVASRFRADIHSRLELPRHVPADVGRTVCRVIHEGLVNACKHARPGPIHVEARGDCNTVHLAIHDAGSLDESSAPGAERGAGKGLLLLEARVRAHGGDLRFEAGPDGSVLAATIALGEPSPDGDSGAHERHTMATHGSTHG